MAKLDKKTFEQALIDRHGMEIHRKLSAATVAICGLGGLGSNVAVSLARINVGRLILIDFDFVDVSNLNRQQYFVEQVEKAKTDALYENLTNINPYIEYECHNVKINPENLVDLVGKADIITECFDLADQKQMLVENVLTKLPGKVIIYGSGMAGFGNSNAIVTRKLNDRVFMAGDGKTGASSENSLMAPRVAIAAAHQANAITEYIINGKIETDK